VAMFESLTMLVVDILCSPVKLISGK
jgi:hypothetical protein